METRVPITGIHTNACRALRHVIPMLKRDRQGSWEQAVDKTSCVSALWVQLRDPAMVKKAELGKAPLSALPPQHAHACSHIRIHPIEERKLKRKESI